jgi:dTMP kinase
MFITLEGSEGSGKSSQIPKLAETLKAAGYKVFTTREPGGTLIGDQIRAVLLNKSHTEMHMRTEVLLLQASRAQLVEQVIKPHLLLGEIVLCDRYADSSLAYQAYGYGIDPELIRPIINYATCGLKPDLTLLLDVDIEAGLKRRYQGGELNRLDTYQLEFYQRVRQGYYQMAQSEPKRWVIIDANQSPEQVEEEIQKIVFGRLGR